MKSLTDNTPFSGRAISLTLRVEFLDEYIKEDELHVEVIGDSRIERVKLNAETFKGRSIGDVINELIQQLNIRA
jgi:hypothetical protein